MSDAEFTSARPRGRPVAHELISRRDTLLAAQGVFIQRGYHAATLTEIAKRVGVTRSALVYHFRSKQELYSELLISADRSLRRIIEEALTAQRLVDQLRRFVTALSEEPALATFLVNASAEIKRHPEWWPAWLDIANTISEFVATALRAAVRRGELTVDPRPAVVDLMTAMLMGMCLKAAFPPTQPLDELFTQFVALLTGSWRRG